MTRLFSSDLDGTLIGNPEATLAFRKTWEALDEERQPLLLYNSGRLLDDTRAELARTDLPPPDYLICGVGTIIYDVEEQQTIKEFTENLTVGWDYGKVIEILSNEPDIARQPDKYQHPFKSSWYLYDASPEQIAELRRKLGEAGLRVNVIYSSSRDLDILPKYANKGNSLKWLMDQLDIPPQETIVAGDTGNDSLMFQIDGVRGIIVQNAQPELFEATVNCETYAARKPYAEGVLEGLLHYGVIERIESADPAEVSRAQFDPEIQRIFASEPVTSLTQNERDLIETAYQKALEALRRNITPLGFSACSIEDNTFDDADANYRSVWGRDGGMAIIGTLSLRDEDIRECQRNTLNSLLRHVSPNGQIPSNVRIETDQPDYSGTGGIASIDSGLWLIIAFYYFVYENKDYDFLRSWADTLQKAMDWLSAHDSNNDALLEIPEAGDWTDLFGRSYNVLYDETLWYSANLCYGRLMELLGDNEKATGYMRWAQTIRDTILRKFWPTVRSDPLAHNYADRQYTLGETHYLLAEISPFGFDWRCDVYANLLAALHNVLDIERARIAFRFMWGVGVNDPWPVVNLYPPVGAGDPDWRPYYTVNLLNLPHHYHNGGCWPFIGAQWVRFIYRLGLRDIALRELAKLAEANRAGVTQEWEFNEWLHGKTGKPMGKAYQAWSASSFIHACHDLRLAELVKNHKG